MFPGCRFPIGKTEQVKKWPGDALKSFWSKWYFPANATLYIVGDLDRDIEATKELIQKTFGKIPAQTEPAEQRNSTGGHEHISSFLKRRHDVRPPVEHRWIQVSFTLSLIFAYKSPALNFPIAPFTKVWLWPTGSW